MTHRFIVWTLIFWQLIVIATTLISVRYLPLRDKFFGGMELAGVLDPNPFLRNPVLYSRANFDGISYINIARGTRIGVSQQAYFPLYTILISIFGPVFKNHNFAGVFISLVSFVIGIFIFKKLISLDYSEAVSRWVYLSLLFFPTSFYFGSIYTEGLFFLLAVLTFYFARTGRWWLAGLVGALASYTRITGIILFPALLIESLYHSQFKKSLPILLIPLGLTLFMWQSFRSAGDPLAFLHVQSIFAQGRSDNLILIPQVFWRYLKIFLSFNSADPLFYTILLEFLTSVVFFLLSLFSFFRLRLSYSIYNILCFILPTLTGTFTSMPRYVLECFPAFLLIGLLLSKTRPVYRYVYLSVSILLGIFYLSLFVRGFWVS